MNALSNAFEITREDVAAVVELHSYLGRQTRPDIEEMFEALDTDAVVHAALRADDMNEQTKGAYDEIFRQLVAAKFYDDTIAEWTGQHYARNFSAMSDTDQGEYRERFVDVILERPDESDRSDTSIKVSAAPAPSYVELAAFAATVAACFSETGEFNVRTAPVTLARIAEKAKELSATFGQQFEHFDHVDESEEEPEPGLAP